jgi:DNA-binding transcriptional regulator YhcF (GntR family)
MRVDPAADRPLYKQLADLIRAQIERGELVPGQRLPTDPERRVMRLGEGVPVLVVTGHRGGEELHPADRTEVVAGGPGPMPSQAHGPQRRRQATA